MKRRDFIKTTSAITAGSLLLGGCKDEKSTGKSVQFTPITK